MRDLPDPALASSSDRPPLSSACPAPAAGVVSPQADSAQHSGQVVLRPCRPEVEIWGLRLLPVTMDESLNRVEQLVAAGQPGYFITANLHYAMLSARDPRLSEVNRDAAFLLADGMPMVWYSRLTGRPLPERVAGSDMIYQLCQRGAKKGWRAFFLGGALGVAEDAADRLHRMYPGLRIAGVESPPFVPGTPEEEDRLVERIAASNSDLLFVALGQPKGELWIHQNYQRLKVPACVQVGASFDFVAGRLQRAPEFFQKTGLEWAWRMCHEPRRLAPRYFQDACFLARAIASDAMGGRAGNAGDEERSAAASPRGKS